jgi:hypothetical protein
MTPEAADMLTTAVIGLVIGWALRSALYHFSAWLRARRLQTLLQKSTIFRFRI